MEYHKPGESWLVAASDVDWRVEPVLCPWPAHRDAGAVVKTRENDDGNE
ncbi:MAG: hypothetical protein ACQESR_24240 [Planctomycetota bacterium]